MSRTLEFAPVPADELDTWSRERSSEELYNLLGRRMAAVALDNTGTVDAEEFDEDATLYDLLTV